MTIADLFGPDAYDTQLVKRTRKTKRSDATAAAVPDSDAWRTDPAVIAMIRAHLRLPPFALDMCASATNTIAPLWMGPTHPDPMMRDSGRMDAAQIIADATQPKAPIWCNPPYSGVGPFVATCARLGRMNRRAVMLIPSALETGPWCDLIASHASRVIVPRSRLGYVDGTGNVVAGAKITTVFVLFGWPRRTDRYLPFEWLPEAPTQTALIHPQDNR